MNGIDEMSVREGAGEFCYRLANTLKTIPEVLAPMPGYHHDCRFVEKLEAAARQPGDQWGTCPHLLYGQNRASITVLPVTKMRSSGIPSLSTF